MAEKTLKAAICDDTPMEAELLATRLQEYGQGPGRPGVRLRLFTAAATLQGSLDAGEAYDVIFMDIVLPGEDGLSFVRRQRGAGRRLPVVFLSNVSGCEEEARALHALGCLLKPVKKAALFPLLDGLRQTPGAGPAALAAPEQGPAIAAVDGSLFFAGDIITAKKKRRRCECRLADGRTATCAADAPGMAAWLAGGNTLWVTPSLAAGMDKIIRFSPSGITMADGSLVKLPPMTHRDLSARYMAYLSRR